MDADLSTPLDEIDKLFIAANRSQAAIGSRAIDQRLDGFAADVENLMTAVRANAMRGLYR